MGEGGGGGSKLSVGGFISPGIGIIKSWQGIVEIALRGSLIVSFDLYVFCILRVGWVMLVVVVTDLKRNSKLRKDITWCCLPTNQIELVSAP